MLDLRYHVASLSAVFLALIVGILVGVGISGRGFVDKSERRNFENRITALQSQVDKLSAQKSLLAQQGAAERTFAQQTYPVLMRNRLAGKRIAVVVLGGSGAVGDVRRAVADAGGAVALYRVLKEPIPAPDVRSALRDRPGFQTLDAIGHEVGIEWVSPGKTPIADAVSSLVVEEQRGRAGTAVDGVVVLGHLPTDAPTVKLVTGLISGLGDAGLPSVAVERSDSTPSQVNAYGQLSSLSTVDDVESPSGKLSLVLLLGGAPGGHFGIKPTADAPLPRIEPAP